MNIRTFAVVILLCFISLYTAAQVSTSPQADSSVSTDIVNTDEILQDDIIQDTDLESQSFHQVLREKFIEGGAGWMAPILICLIFGLALAIERILYLNTSSTNTDKLLKKIETTLEKEGIEGAKKECDNTNGHIAGVFKHGLDHYDQGMEMVEKSIISYGSVVGGKLESNLTWIALFIAIAPMLGFLGTVVGMVHAFDSIEAAGDIGPSIVAGGIKVALLTTVFGLIVAIILQVLYNYIVSKIDNIINSMEDATISFIDMLVKFRNK